MARALRVNISNSWHHVSQHGRCDEPVFKHESDSLMLMELLREVCERYPVEIYAWCILPSAYHLLVRSLDGDISRVMKHINGLYTRRLNKKYNWNGSFFKGRFRSTIIQQEYVPQVSRYLHHLPLTTGLAQTIEDYKWSSISHFYQIKDKPLWVSQAKWREFNNRELNSKDRNYEAFMNEGIDKLTKQAYKKNLHPVAIGDSDFILELRDCIEHNHYEQPQYKQLKIHPAPQLIIDVVASKFNVSKQSILEGKRGILKTNNPRKIAMFLFQNCADCKLAEIATYFGLKHYASVANHICSIKKVIKNNKELNSQVKELVSTLTGVIPEG